MKFEVCKQNWSKRNQTNLVERWVKREGVRGGYGVVRGGGEDHSTEDIYGVVCGASRCPWWWPEQVKHVKLPFLVGWLSGVEDRLVVGGGKRQQAAVEAEGEWTEEGGIGLGEISVT